ncbi:hypothetical protein, partial [Hydrogenophaga sp.]|uniref:hypothetical protein n=1 Tax=Hydrogenophaga sp. TaxID=1904254 RepID=UPI0035647F21
PGTPASSSLVWQRSSIDLSDAARLVRALVKNAQDDITLDMHKPLAKFVAHKHQRAIGAYIRTP